MKKILGLLGTITLIGTSTTSLVACNTPNEYTPEELAKLKGGSKINVWWYLILINIYLLK